MGIRWIECRGEYTWEKQVLPSLTGRTIIYFVGDRALHGDSWCPDCVKSDRIMEKIKDTIDQTKIPVNFVTILVGKKEVWKDPNNHYRKVFNLKSIPTVMLYDTDVRFEEDEVTENNIIDLFF
uniref:Thioredoxin domain-containing protein 17 n=1 Tax=Panagrellus redivivus TaxID=6233 RepID=A0A7E4V1M2_PANRE